MVKCIIKLFIYLNHIFEKKKQSKNFTNKGVIERIENKMEMYTFTMLAFVPIRMHSQKCERSFRPLKQVFDCTIKFIISYDVCRLREFI